MRAKLISLLILSACGFPTITRENSSGSGNGTDASPILPDAQQCFGSIVKICLTGPSPTAAATLTADIDTDSSICDQSNDHKDKYCVILGGGAGITVPASTNIRVFGSKPLVLLSTAAFDLSGDIDVSSTSVVGAPHPLGAGAMTGTGCADGTSPPDHNAGGFGGSFGGRGGNGAATTGNGGKASAAIDPPSILRGGCPGGQGSSDSIGLQGGAGGAAGGAIAIIATNIHLNGRINASGAGGLGGPLGKSGAGGGGSGGMIVLDVTTITVDSNGILLASGAGGGQGGATVPSSGAGINGSEPASPSTGATGGSSGSTNGGTGGTGSFGVVKLDGATPGTDAGTGGGDGGGGGGAGFISAHGVSGANVVAPPPITIPPFTT
jgi:hypothetical protein